VTEAELNEWLGGEGTLEALFLGKIAESAFPTVVHSPVTASTSSSRYRVVPAYLPFSIYRPWRREELTQERPVSARARLGLEPGQAPIATFGFVQASKAPEECVWALEVLRRWGIAASFHFVGDIEPDPQIARLHALIREEVWRDIYGSQMAMSLETQLAVPALVCGQR
jgi:hypothetical protein